MQYTTPGIYKLPTYNDNKLYFVDVDGQTYNYVVINKNRYGECEYNETYLIESMNIGDIDATLELARMYARSFKTTDVTTTYERVASSGSIIALRELGDYYRTCKDLKTAKKYYKMAASSGDIKSMIRVGLIYSQIGKIDKAILFYELAAKNNSICAMCLLGDYYKNKEDYGKMIKWYKRAINNGFKFAQISFDNVIEKLIQD